MNRTRVVVEASSPVRRLLVMSIAALLAIASLFLAYDVGQRRAGFNRLAAIDEVTELQATIEEQTLEIRKLREQAAILETAARIDKEAYSQVDVDLVELQAKVSELEENLEFYRGIVSPDDTKGLQVQDLRITELDSAGQYRVQIYLTQALRSDRTISGQVSMRLAGRTAAGPAELDIGGLSIDSGLKAPDRFSFLYFQELVTDIALPEGFTPENLIIEARPDGKNSKTVEESFFWALKGE